MDKKHFLLAVVVNVLTLMGCSSNANVDNESNNMAGNSQLVGSKWTLINWDYSLGDDYIGLHDETYQFFFHNLTEGVFYYGRKDNYSDQGSSRQRIACHFKYTVSNGEIVLHYITDKYLSDTYLSIENGKLIVGNLEFSKSTITNTDTQWLNTIRGQSGSCYWYSDMYLNLWIAGNGEMENYTSYSSTPWAKNNRTPNNVFVCEGVETIGSNAFADSSIVKVEMPDKSLKRIGKRAFMTSLIEEIEIDNNVTHIEEEAFYNCPKLKDIDIPKNIVEIGDYAFSGCTALNEFQLDFGENLERIGNFAFEGGEASYVIFKEGVQDISSGAFIGNYCSISKELILPNSLKSIGATVFEGKINKIVLGKGLKSIGDKAFISSVSAGEVHINLSTPPTTGANLIVERSNWEPVESRWTLYIPKGCKSAYSNKSPWNKFKSIIEDGTLDGGSNNDDVNDNDNSSGSEDDSSVAEYSDQAQDEKDSKDYRRGPVAKGFARGTGTLSDPYIISTAAELRYFSDAVRGGNVFKNQYIKLDADITINQNVLTRYGELNGDGSNFEPWIPIGRIYPSYFFCGTFDGDNHYVSGLYCNRPQGREIGFFGVLFGNVKNLIIKDSYFHGNCYVGGIVGRASMFKAASTIPSSLSDYYKNGKDINFTSCINESTVVGNNCIGGITSDTGISSNSNKKVKVSRCLNTGIVICLADGNKNAYVGGLVGIASETTISDSANVGDIISQKDGSGSIGGLVGRCYGSSIINSLNSGSIQTTNGFNIGGLVGTMSSPAGKMQYCVNYATIIEGSKAVGALVGNVYNYTVQYNMYLFQNGVNTPAIGTYSNSTIKSNDSKTKEELQSKEVLDLLNSRAGSSYCKWENGKNGFPVLEYME